MIETIDSRQLLAFCTLVQTGSFTETASLLNLTQSAISHSVRNLEADVRCQLVTRSGRKIHITADGEELYRDAQAILHQMEEARNRIQERTNWGKGRLRIGASTTACQHILPNVLREFNECFPDCILSITPGDTPELVLADLLRQYRDLRNARLAQAGARERAAELLVVTNLQKRLLSSIYGFDRTLNVHIDTLKKREAAGSHGSANASRTKLERLDLLQEGIDGDDDRAEISDDELEAEAAQQHATALGSALQVQPEEWELLEQMQRISSNAKFRADARVGWLEDWIRQHLCPNLGQQHRKADDKLHGRRSR